MDEHRYAALVKGSSAIFPRGYLWLIPVWYAAIAAAIVIKGKPPFWYGASALLALSLAAITVMAVLSTLRSNAFLADDDGIWLGLRAGGRRKGRRRRDYRYLAWPEIAELRIAARLYGARLDVVLAPGPNARGRHAFWHAVATGVTVVIPLAYLFRAPGLLRPRSDPPRYRVPLHDVTTAELQAALAPLAPPGVAIAVRPRWRTRVGRRLQRLRPLRRSRLTTAA